jgi:heme/copper-type cytochrome/quinol oxidase subunit 2
MSIELFLYLIDLIASIGIMSCLLFFILIIILIVELIKAFNDDDDEGKFKYSTKLKKYFCILAIIIMIIPSEKTMYLMLGSNYLKKSDIPQKVELAINKKLDEYLNEGTKQ